MRENTKKNTPQKNRPIPSGNGSSNGIKINRVEYTQTNTEPIKNTRREDHFPK
jgi:hypothetical protein